MAIVLAAALFLAPPQRPVWFVASITLSAIALSGLLLLWFARRTPETETIADPAFLNLQAQIFALPLQERIRYFRRQLVIAVVVFSGLSAWDVHFINGLEAGRAPSIPAWPVTVILFLYSHFGYWSAVLTVPAIGVALCGILVFRLINPGPESTSAHSAH